MSRWDSVTPARAGVQGHAKVGAVALDSGLRRNGEIAYIGSDWRDLI